MVQILRGFDLIIRNTVVTKHRQRPLHDMVESRIYMELSLRWSPSHVRRILYPLQQSRLFGPCHELYFQRLTSTLPEVMSHLMRNDPRLFRGYSQDRITG